MSSELARMRQAVEAAKAPRCTAQMERLWKQLVRKAEEEEQEAKLRMNDELKAGLLDPTNQMLAEKTKRPCKAEEVAPCKD